MWFKLFASCIIVKGESSSIICDIERNAFYDLPNDFIEILELSKFKNIFSLKKHYNNEQDEVIDSFFNQLINEEIAFYTNDPESFPEIDLTWESPNHITNAIIEIDNSSKINISNLASQLDSLACKAIQIRILDEFSVNELKNLLLPFDESRIHHIELLIPYNATMDHNSLFSLRENHARLNRIMIYAAPEEKIIEHEKNLYNKTIIHFKKDIRIDLNEKIKVDRFTANIDLFTEAQKYNLGLNRKVCIDKRGEIKNYFSHSYSFGNIQTDKIEDIIKKRDFQEKWFLSNDKIEICKGCQYRYVCVSNSDIEKVNDKYFKIDKCKFDPLLNLWQ